ncbi:MAG: GIY-YIG nuclease family protein [Terriglobia bacterium]
MFYVYILRSESRPDQTYVGTTGNLRQRLVEHNAGKSPHTRKFMPWGLIFYAAFPEKMAAERFEVYLKSGSGRAFARRHLIHLRDSLKV